MKNLKLAIGSLIGGGAITILTSLISTTPQGFVGASLYGFPFTWNKKLVLAPQYPPWYINWWGFLGDVIFWAIVVFVILHTAKYLMDSSKNRSQKGKK